MEAILGRPSGGCIDEKGTLLASAYYSVQLAAGVLFWALPGQRRKCRANF